MFAFLEGSFGGTYSTVPVATPDGSGERDLVSVNDVDLFVLSPAGQPASPFVAFDLARAGDPTGPRDPRGHPTGRRCASRCSSGATCRCWAWTLRPEDPDWGYASR